MRYNIYIFIVQSQDYQDA